MVDQQVKVVGRGATEEELLLPGPEQLLQLVSCPCEKISTELHNEVDPHYLRVDIFNNIRL